MLQSLALFDSDFLSGFGKLGMLAMEAVTIENTLMDEWIFPRLKVMARKVEMMITMASIGD